MLARTLRFTAGAALLAAAVGCSPTQTPQPKDQSFSAYQQQELESERQEFITESKKRIEEIDNEIARLQTRLTYEAQYVDAEQRADWSQRLWNLKQESQQLTQAVDRAQTASAAEWAEMRSDLGGAVDMLQANTSKIANEIASVFSDDDDEPDQQRTAGRQGQQDAQGQQGMEGQQQGESGQQQGWTGTQQRPPNMIDLCALDVAGTDAQVDTSYNRVVLTVTTDDQSKIDMLREGAQQIANHDAYPSLETNDQGQTKMLQVRTWVETTSDGVRVMFAPQDTTSLSTLESAIQKDAEQLGEGNCEARPVITKRDVPSDRHARAATR